MAFGSITSWQIEGGKRKQGQILFSWAPKSLPKVTTAMNFRDACYDKPRQHFANKGPDGQNYGFSSSCVQMWELNHKEGWAPKNLCFQIVMLEKTLVSPLDCKEIKPVHPKGNQPWMFIGRTIAKAAILWPPDGKSQHTGKDLDAGKDWRQEEKGATEDEMVG